MALQLIVREREFMHHSCGPCHPYANWALSSAPKRQCYQVWVVQARMDWSPWETSSGTRIKKAVGVAQLASATPHWQPFPRPSPKCTGNSSTFSYAPHCHLFARDWWAAPACLVLDNRSDCLAGTMIDSRRSGSLVIIQSNRQ